MYQLNYIYFLIITFLGLYFLLNKGVAFKNPLNSDQLIKCSGVESFWILTFSTGLLAFSAPAGLDLMAIRLLMLEFMCVICLFKSNNRAVFSLPLCIYIAYMIWVSIGCFYSPAPAYGFRVLLKYIYPLLIALVASSVVRDKEVFLKAGLGARAVAVASLVTSFVPFANYLLQGVFWYGTAQAINYISICVFSLALFFYTDEKRKNLFYTVVFMLPCVVWVFRTSIMGTAMALMMFSVFKYKIKALPMIAIVLMLFLLAIFAIPSVKEKMFYKDANNSSISALEQGSISTDDINSNGRFAMWEWSLERFYNNKKLQGSGTGNLQETFYSLRHPFGTIKICHNDYVQILCDNGIVGLVLYLSSYLFLIVHCFYVFQCSRYDISIKICAIIAGASAAGVLLTSYTDNVVNYSMATISYPYGFYGMMMGLITRSNQ